MSFSTNGMPPEQKDPRIPIKSLRTYQGDVEEALHKNNLGTTNIFVAEQKRKEKEPVDLKQQEVKTENRNKFFVTIGISLFILGIIAVGGVYYLKNKEQVVVIQKTKALISFSQEKDFVIENSTRAKLSSEILSENKSFKLPPNSVLYINTTTAKGDKADVSSVLTTLAPAMPASLERAFEGEYMIGVYSFDKNSPFIILSTKDFGSSWSGMLKWEKDIVSDLGKIFEVPEDSSTVSGVWADKALKNKDLRILKDSNKNTVLLYSFIDKNTLVITRNEAIFSAVLGKYVISQQER